MDASENDKRLVDPTQTTTKTALIAAAPEQQAKIDRLEIEQSDLIARVNRLALEVDTAKAERDELVEVFRIVARLKAERDELLEVMKETIPIALNLSMAAHQGALDSSLNLIYAKLRAAIAKAEKGESRG